MPSAKSMPSLPYVTSEGSMSGDSDEEGAQTAGNLGVVRRHSTSIFDRSNDAKTGMRRHSAKLLLRPIGLRGSVTVALPELAGSSPSISESRNLRNHLLCAATKSQSCPQSPLTKTSEKQRDVEDEMGIPTPSSSRLSTKDYSVLRWVDRKRSVNCEESPPSPSVSSRSLGHGHLKHKDGFIIGSVRVLSVCVAGHDVTRHVMEDMKLRRNLKVSIVPASLVFSVHTVDTLLNRLSASVQDDIFNSTKTPSCYDVAIRYMDPEDQMEMRSSKQAEQQQRPILKQDRFNWKTLIDQLIRKQDPTPQQCADPPRDSGVEQDQDPATLRLAMMFERFCQSSPRAFFLAWKSFWQNRRAPAPRNFSALKRSLALHVDTNRDESQHPCSSSRVSTLQFSVSSGDHHIVLFTTGKLTSSGVLETCSWQGRDALWPMRRKVWAADGAMLSRQLLDSLVGGSVDGPFVLGSQQRNKLFLSFPVLENNYIAKHLVVLKSDGEYRVHAVYPSQQKGSRAPDSPESGSPRSPK